MKNKKALILAVIVVGLLIPAVIFGLRALRNSSADTKPSGGDELLSGQIPVTKPEIPIEQPNNAVSQANPGEEVSLTVPENAAEQAILSDWIPFVVDRSQETPLEGFLYEGSPVKPAAVLEMAESGNKELLILEKVKEKAPDYPFDKIPLLQPDMLVTGSQGAFGDDVSVDVLYYPLSSVDEALTFYRKALAQYENVREEVYESSTGNSYTISFAIPGEYKMHASVMVMGMPQTTGYSCAVNIHIAIRGLNKKEEIVVETRADGLPGNFPDQLVRVYKLQELVYSEGYSDSCYVQFYSTAPYDEIVDFYRKELSGRFEFKEHAQTDTEVSMGFSAPGWTVELVIMDNEGSNSYAEINCYQQ